MDYYFLAAVALAALVVAYEKSRNPGAVPKVFRLGHWVHLITFIFGVTWVFFGFYHIVAGRAFENAVTLLIAGTIIWSAGWAYHWALRPEVNL